MKLFSTFLKDLTLSFRSYYIYIEIIMAIVFIAVLLFVVPESFESSSRIYASINLDVEKISMMLEQMPLNSEQRKEMEQLLQADLSGDTDPASIIDDWPQGLVLKSSAAEIKTALEADHEAYGMILSMTDDRLDVEFILQGFESDRLRNLLSKQVSAPLLAMMPGYTINTSTTVLTDTVQKLPDRINILPVLLVLNSAFVGLFIIAAYIFMDKEEGTIKALAVTPAAVWQYLLSKVGVMLFTGLLTGTMMVVAIAHQYVNIGHFLVLLISFNLFGSALGLLVASFYDTLTKSLGTLYLVIIILSLTSLSYFMPAFSPLVIKLLPSYPMLFAMRETLLDKPDLSYIYISASGFVIAGILLFVLASIRYRKTITI